MHGLGQCDVPLLPTQHRVNHNVTCTKLPRQKQNGLENAARCSIWGSRLYTHILALSQNVGPVLFRLHSKLRYSNSIAGYIV